MASATPRSHHHSTTNSWLDDDEVLNKDLVTHFNAVANAVARTIQRYVPRFMRKRAQRFFLSQLGWSLDELIASAAWRGIEDGVSLGVNPLTGSGQWLADYDETMPISRYFMFENAIIGDRIIRTLRWLKVESMQQLRETSLTYSTLMLETKFDEDEMLLLEEQMARYGLEITGSPHVVPTAPTPLPGFHTLRPPRRRA